MQPLETLPKKELIKMIFRIDNEKSKENKKSLDREFKICLISSIIIVILSALLIIK